MRAQESAPPAVKNQDIALDAAPLATAAGRLFGLDAGDWSMVLLGLLLSGLLLALV